jgi:thymidylate synthase
MIPSFCTVDEMFYDACRRINVAGQKIPSRDGDSQEITGYCGRLNNPRANFVFNSHRKLNPFYAAAEFLWYLSNTNNIEMIKAYAPQYVRFTEDGEHAWGAYGNRWIADPAFIQESMKHHEQLNFDLRKTIVGDTLQAPLSQIQAVAWLLQKNPLTRQAVIGMWNPGDLLHAIIGDKKDIPCTTTLNFLIRDNKLNLVANMRSNDVWLGFPYDVWSFTNLQILLADFLNIDIGWYQHQAMSLHIYERNREPFLKVCEKEEYRWSKDEDYNEMVEGNSFCYSNHKTSLKLSQVINEAILIEKEIRNKNCFSIVPIIDRVGDDSLFGQLLCILMRKWNGVFPLDFINNEKMIHHIERYF